MLLSVSPALSVTTCFVSTYPITVLSHLSVSIDRKLQKKNYKKITAKKDTNYFWADSNHYFILPICLTTQTKYVYENTVVWLAKGKHTDTKKREKGFASLNYCKAGVFQLFKWTIGGRMSGPFYLPTGQLETVVYFIQQQVFKSSVFGWGKQWLGVNQRNGDKPCVFKFILYFSEHDLKSK